MAKAMKFDIMSDVVVGCQGGRGGGGVAGGGGGSGGGEYVLKVRSPCQKRSRSDEADNKTHVESSKMFRFAYSVRKLLLQQIYSMSPWSDSRSCTATPCTPGRADLGPRKTPVTNAVS